jgi:hypothetical protein
MSIGSCLDIKAGRSGWVLTRCCIKSDTFQSRRGGVDSPTTRLKLGLGLGMELIVASEDEDVDVDVEKDETVQDDFLNNEPSDCWRRGWERQ